MMSFEDFKTCVDKLPLGMGIWFAGWGEPELNPAFCDMVLYANQAGRTLSLNSALVGMTRESYERIRDVPFKSVILHIPDQEGNSRFDLSTEYLEMLDLVLADAAMGRFNVSGYSCHGSVHTEVVKLFEKNAIPLPQSKFSQLQDRAGNVNEEGIKHQYHRFGRVKCPRRLNHNVLLPDGTLCLCCMDFGMEYILGNLLTQSYEKIMEGDVIQDLRFRMSSPKHGDCICRHCPYSWTGLPIKRAISYIRRRTHKVLSVVTPRPVKRTIKYILKRQRT